MIADQVTVSNNHKYVEIAKWCNTYVGQRAMFKDNVNQHNAWHLQWNFGTATYSFADEKHATMFRLRWT